MSLSAFRFPLCLSALRSPLSALALLLLPSLAVADVCVIVTREIITEIDDEQQTTNTTARYVFTLPPDDRRIGQLQDALTTSVDAPAIAVSNAIAAASLRLLGWVGDHDNVTVVLP